MRCPNCGRENPENRERCVSCGIPFEKVDAETTISFEPVGEVEEEELGEEFQPGETPILVVKKGPAVGERFPLTKPEISLGRDPRSDIFLNDITVSRRHAKIQIKGDHVFISDAGSLNGTYVNRERVEKSELRHGDELQIGKFKLVFLPKRG